MLVLQKIVLPTVNAAIITTALVYCMFLLIKSPPLELTEHKSYKLDWVSVPEDPEVETPKKRLAKPKQAEEKPIIERVSFKTELDVKNSIHIPVNKIVIPKNDIDIYRSDQLTLSFAYPAIYPSNKLNRGIEGYVVVGFSVNPVGEVYDAYVIESEPKGAFDKSALTAIAKFKYKPRYDDKRAVSTDGQQYVFRYEIEE